MNIEALSDYKDGLLAFDGFRGHVGLKMMNFRVSPKLRAI
jgi:hypothetical protein